MPLSGGGQGTVGAQGPIQPFEFNTQPPQLPVSTAPDGVGLLEHPQPWPNYAKRLAYYAAALVTATGLFWTPPPPQSTGGGAAPATIRIKVAKRYATRAPNFFWSGFTPAAAVLPDASWQPEYPDIVRDKQYLSEAVRSTTGSAVSGPFQPPPSGGGSLPTVNYFTIGRSFSYTSPSFFWSGFTPTFTFPDLSWGPEYPDIVSGKRYLSEAIDTSDGQSPIGLPPADESVSADRWVQPQSQPFPARKTLAVSQQVAFFWHISTQPEVVTEDRWHPIWPQPWPGKKYLTEAVDSSDGQSPLGAPPSAETVTADRWAQPQSQPTQRKQAQQQVNQFVFTQTELFEPSSVQPQQQKRNRAIYEAACSWSTFTPATEVIFTNWLPSYPDRVPGKRNLLTSQQQAFFWHISTAGEDTSPDVWEYQLPQPYPAKRVLSTANQLSFFWHITTDVEQVSEDRWHQPQSQPYPYKRYPNVGPSLAWSAFTPPYPDLSWSPEYPDIVRGKRYLTEAVDSSDGQSPTGAAITPEDVTEDRWHHTQSQPWPGKKYLGTANQLYFTWGVFTPPDTLFESHWHPTYPQPFPKKPYLQTAEVPSFFWNASTQQEAVTEDKWHFQSPQPYSFRPYRPAAVYPNFFWNTSTQQEQVSADKFSQPQSQPVVKKRVLQPEVQWIPFTPQAASAVFLDWYQATNQPTLKKTTRNSGSAVFSVPFIAQTTGGGASPETLYISVAKLHAPRIPYFFWSGFTPIPQTGPELLGWQQPGSQPYPAKKRIRTAHQLAFWFVEQTCIDGGTEYGLGNYGNGPYERGGDCWDETITADKFAQPQSQPYPAKKNLRTVNQASFFWPPSIQAESVTEDRWHHTQSQPWPGKKYLNTASQQASFWSGFTPPDLTGLLHFHPIYPQPFPKKRYLQTAAIPSNFWNTSTSPEAVTEDKWHHTQSQPYPYRRYLNTASQQACCWSGFTPPDTTGLLHFHPILPQPFPKKRYISSLYENGIWSPFTPPPPPPILLDWQQPQSQPYPYKKKLLEAIQSNFAWSTLTPVEVIPPFVHGQGQVFQVVFEHGSVTQQVTVSGKVDQITGRGKTG